MHPSSDISYTLFQYCYLLDPYHLIQSQIRVRVGQQDMDSNPDKLCGSGFKTPPFLTGLTYSTYIHIPLALQKNDF